MDDRYEEVILGDSPKIPKKEESLGDEKENDGASSSPSGRSSPEANCPICLGKLENKSFTDSCLHQFCFTCLLEWSKVKAECPLCKQSFKSIIHNVRSIEDYEQYYLNQAVATDGRLLGIFTHYGYESSQPREGFRYRTTAVSSYLDYFVRLEEAFSHHVIPSVPTHSGSTHWQRRRQFGTSDFRRNIYQQGLWVQRMRDVTGRVRDCSPEFYRANPALVHRLVPWLNRELNVLLNNNEPHVQHLLSRILELITQFPIRSPSFTAVIAPYMARHTEHFVHEFYSFASSPFDLIGYDRHANYVTQNALAHEILSDPSENEDDSDVQVVGAFGPTTATSPLHSIQLDSDSDDCVVVNSVPPRQSSPEVITIESEREDDDVVQVNIHIANQPGPSRRRPLKRNWLTVQNVQVPTLSNDNVNVSINIAHANRSQSSSSVDTSSSSSWSPSTDNIPKIKNKKKRNKEKESFKGKSFTCKDKRNVKRTSVKGTDDRSPSPVVVPRKRRPSVILQSSDDDEDSNTLHIVTDHYSSSSSDEPKSKPRLRSVVIKSNVKSEPRDVSPEHLSSNSRSDNHWIDSNSESHDYNCTLRSYHSFDPDLPECSNTSWSDPYRASCHHRRRSISCTSSTSEKQSNKKFKYCKKRSKRDKF